MKFKFNGVCLITNDVSKLSRFYSEVLQTDVQGDEGFCILPTRGAELSIYSIRGMEEMASGSMNKFGYGGFTLEFAVDNVDEEFERLKHRGIDIVKLPTTQPWGRRSFWFRDPDGNIVNFYSVLNSISNHPE